MSIGEERVKDMGGFLDDLETFLSLVRGRKDLRMTGEAEVKAYATFCVQASRAHDRPKGYDAPHKCEKCGREGIEARYRVCWECSQAAKAGGK